MSKSWIDITREVGDIKPEEVAQGGSPFDIVRKLYYKEFTAITKRPLIVYASAFHFQPKAALFGNLMSIDLSDKDGFQEVTDKLKGNKVDIWIHSPGGSAEAAESIVY